MSNLEKAELILIAAVTLSLFVFTKGLAMQVGLARVLLSAAALLLVQSLIRDLFILLTQRNANKVEEVRQAQCMCVESSVGLVGVVIGLMMFAVGIDHSIEIAPATLASIVVGVLFFGFVIKDYVVEWSPWKIYKDKDHMNIVFAWKR